VNALAVNALDSAVNALDSAVNALDSVDAVDSVAVVAVVDSLPSGHVYCLRKMMNPCIDV
jgi:hypothetical protein